MVESFKIWNLLPIKPWNRDTRRRCAHVLKFVLLLNLVEPDMGRADLLELLKFFNLARHLKQDLEHFLVLIHRL